MIRVRIACARWREDGPWLGLHASEDRMLRADIRHTRLELEADVFPDVRVEDLRRMLDCFCGSPIVLVDHERACPDDKE